MNAALGAAIGGVGVTCALSHQARGALRDGSLVALLSAFAPPSSPVHLVYPAASTAAAKVRAFLELVTTVLRVALANCSGKRRR